MIPNPGIKYKAFPAIDLPDRTWPARTIGKPPIWLSTDLRDGNQALFEPMNLRRTLRLFDELVRIGFREIEIGFPSASQIDFDVARALIDEDRIAAQVTPMVITQAREDLIDRTFESVRGAQRAIVHIYNATAPAWRKIVFGMSVPEVMQLVRRHVEHCRRLADRHPQTQWILEYSPETFCMTELEVALEACNTAIRAWGADAGNPIIVNLPTTVEVATPNVFADQIEWMHRRLERREHVVLSVHPHNDRGTGVACAELAVMAGAQRVEGCLFGNGERSGNVDIVTLALNLYTQGIHPGLDFSDIAAVARIAEECTSLPIHPRHPYVGDLVFTAFSGSHQDAIKKGFAAQREDAIWEVPYLPIDPKDLGRSYESVIRVNSQSGKGGISYLLERDHGVVMPRRMQVEFSAVVQRQADASEAEITSGALWDLFEQTYLEPGRGGERATYIGHRMLAGSSGQEAGQEIELTVECAGTIRILRGSGNGPIDATVRALGGDMRVDHFEERSIGAGSGAQAWAIVEAAAPGIAGSRFGVGRHENIVTASILAVLSAATRLGAFARGQAPARVQVEESST
jgi:2-isopropylmalate synthase